MGDVLDARMLETAGAQDAQAMILALDADSATLFATVILKDLAPEVPVIARVNQAENVERIHRAGADFALSISQVSGQMLAKKLLGQEAVAVDPQLKILKAAWTASPAANPPTWASASAPAAPSWPSSGGRTCSWSSAADFRFQPRGRRLRLRQQRGGAAVPGGVRAGVGRSNPSPVSGRHSSSPGREPWVPWGRNAAALPIPGLTPWAGERRPGTGLMDSGWVALSRR